MKVCTEALLFSDEKCQDCFEKTPVFRHWGDLVPPGSEAKLCADCMAKRSQAFFHGKEIRPIGMLYKDTAEWVDLPGFIVKTERDEIRVSIKYHRPISAHPTIDDGGELRVHFADQPDWLWQDASILDPEIFGASTTRARAEAIYYWKMKLEPDAEILK